MPISLLIPANTLSSSSVGTSTIISAIINNYTITLINVPSCNEIDYSKVENTLCTDNGKLYEIRWKFFKDLKGSEEILTLNPSTQEREWHVPSRYFRYDYGGEMYEIVLENDDSYLVSPEHKVYVKTVTRDTR